MLSVIKKNTMGESWFKQLFGKRPTEARQEPDAETAEVEVIDRLEDELISVRSRKELINAIRAHQKHRRSIERDRRDLYSRDGQYQRAIEVVEGAWSSLVSQYFHLPSFIHAQTVNMPIATVENALVQAGVFSAFENPHRTAFFARAALRAIYLDILREYAQKEAYSFNHCQTETELLDVFSLMDEQVPGGSEVYRSILMESTRQMPNALEQGVDPNALVASIIQARHIRTVPSRFIQAVVNAVFNEFNKITGEPSTPDYTYRSQYASQSENWRITMTP